ASRVQAGKAIAVDPTPLEVGPLLAEAVESFRLTADEKRIDLAWSLRPETPYILADYDRVLQVLTNLLSNAVKFTPEAGQIRIDVEPEGSGWLRISVSDTGPGIREEMLPHIFDPFTQVEDTASLG